MKRTTTILEQKLIANGWYLAGKSYWGKKSEKTFCYEYHKQDETRQTLIIKLDRKREKIIRYGIANVNFPYLSQIELDGLHMAFFSLRDFVDFITKEEPLTMESVE